MIAAPIAQHAASMIAAQIAHTAPMIAAPIARTAPMISHRRRVSRTRSSPSPNGVIKASPNGVTIVVAVPIENVVVVVNLDGDGDVARARHP